MALDNPGAGGIIGANDLQRAIDKLDTVVGKLTSVVGNMATTLSNGATVHPVAASGASGQTITSQPGMGSIPARFANASVPLIGQGSPGGSGQGAPTLNQMAAGGNGAPSYHWTTGWQYGPQTQQGTFGSIGPQPYSGGPGGPTIPPFVNSWSMLGGAAGGAVNAAYTATNSVAAKFVISQGMSQLGNMQLFNAYGIQMQTQWGGSAQTYQNQAFGNGINGIQNNAAAGNAASAAAEFGTLTQMAGGANVTGTAAFGAANALAFANQGLGAAGAAQVVGDIYNPARALGQQMLTGVSAFTPGGSQRSLLSQMSQLASMGYIGGGGLSNGKFNGHAFDASFTAGRGTSWMNLSSLGYSQSDIQDIQSTLRQIYSTAAKNHVSASEVFSEINAAEYGRPGETNNANSQLAKWGIPLSTIQKQGNAAAQNLGQQQSQSSTFNDSVSGFTSAMQKATSAVNWFLDKTGLNKAIGLTQGAGAGWQSSGMSTWVHGIGSILGAVIPGAMGGGAASVSTVQPMTGGSRAGSTMSSGVSGAVQTAVRDAEAQVGKPYVWGGSNPQTSFDCSGLVQWAYGQAGVSLPRTSQQQWAALSNKSVPLNQVREGDIVFSAGSDGTASAPGHEALMISGNQIVEAPYTGANIRIRSYNPGEWQHAARPAGGGGSVSGGTSPVSGTQTGSTGSALSAGNSGGMGDASLGLVSDADAMLFNGTVAAGSPAGGMTSRASNGSASNSATSFTGGGNSAQNQALAQKMAAALYGWTGTQWTDGLLPLWTQESGFQTKATNPTSGAYGIPQSLPANKMASAGSDYLTNPVTQIKWGLSYIKGRYGSPANAEQHERAYNWYGDGGAIVVGDRGPELFVPNQSGTIRNARDTANLLRGSTAQPAQAPWTASPSAQFLLDTLSPASARNGTGGTHGGVTINLGGITVQGGHGFNSQMNGDVYTTGQQIAVAVARELENNALIRDIAKGVTG